MSVCLSVCLFVCRATPAGAPARPYRRRRRPYDRRRRMRRLRRPTGRRHAGEDGAGDTDVRRPPPDEAADGPKACRRGRSRTQTFGVRSDSVGASRLPKAPTKFKKSYIIGPIYRTGACGSARVYVLRTVLYQQLAHTRSARDCEAVS